jgi:integrase
MPAKQRGDVLKRGTTWQARWYDENSHRHARGGFVTKTEARDWLEAQVDEVEALRRGELAPAAERPATVDELLDLFLDKHGRTVDPATRGTLETRLRRARAEFGSCNPDTLRRVELEDWRANLSPGSRPDVFRTFRQALAWAVDRGYLTRDASAGIRNPRRARHERREVHPFETWDEVRAVADELDERYGAIPVVLVGTGLRPEELFGLHRSDVDRKGGLLRVERRYTGGLLKPGGKTSGSVRTVPLRRVVLDALDEMPARIDTQILFPAPRGGYIDIEKFRHREWTPALRAAAIDHRRILDCRHTFATWAMESGAVELWYLAKIMGTSTVQLEDTYARWLTRTDEQLRAAFDAYDAARTGNEPVSAQTT